MSLIQYKSKFESTLFTYNNAAKNSVMLSNDPWKHTQFKENGLSIVVRTAVNTPTLTKIQNTSDYKASQWQRIPSLLQTKHGTLIATYDVRWGNASDIGQRDTYDQVAAISRSTDNGRTWEAPYCTNVWLYHDDDGIYQSGASDPCLAYDISNDVIFQFSICGRGIADHETLPSDKNADLSAATRSQLGMTYSIDDGKTWSDPELVYPNITNGNEVIKGTYARLFGGCSTSITLKHQKNKADNGRIFFPIQFWPDGNGDHARCGILELKPTYDKDEEENITNVHFSGTILGCRLGAVTGACECSLCEDENGTLVMAYRTNYNVNHYDYKYQSLDLSAMSVSIAKSADCGNTWKLIGDVKKNDDAYACSTLRGGQRCKTSICYSDFSHKYYIAYHQGISRTLSMIRYSTDLYNWHVFDATSLLEGAYQSIIPLNDQSKLGFIHEKPGDYHSKYIDYIEYDLLRGTQTEYANNWQEYVTNSNLTKIEGKTNVYDLGRVQGIDFTIASFTDKSSICIDKLGIEEGDITPKTTIYIALYVKNSSGAYELVKNNAGTDAISNKITVIKNQKNIFTFDKPITLVKGIKYYLSFNNTDVPIPPSAYGSTGMVKLRLADYEGDEYTMIDVHYVNDLNKPVLVSPSVFSGNKLSPRIYVYEKYDTSDEYDTYAIIRHVK